MADDLVRDALLHDFSLIQHQHTVAELLHQGDVMADEQNREIRALCPTKLIEQRDDLLLNCHVQGGGRLVADQQFGLDRQGTGDRRALALAAADLMGLAGGKLRCEAALREQAFDFLLRLCPAHTEVSQAFADAVAQCAARVKGIRRRLEHHLHLAVGLA